jgi:NAD(P)-dependent dehydrogenase (short-subunit alcohol dehydrogenase family)
MPGRNALVTGASSGIGRAVALALARQGCRLLLSGRSQDRLTQTAQACAHSPSVSIIAGDVTNSTALAEMKSAIEASFEGQLDILVHCAADLLHAPVEQVAADELRRLLEINVVASFALLRELSPLLSRDSDVVLLNSAHGLVAPAGISPYAASKYALRALADAFRSEVNPRGVRVLSVFCGKTATEMQRRIYESRGEATLYDRIAGEILRPEDVAEFIVAAVSLPRTAEVTEFSIRPLKKV